MNRPPGLSAILLPVALASLIGSAPPGVHRRPVHREDPVESTRDWPKYCGNLAMTGLSASRPRIDSSNVARLLPLWSLALGGPIASSPSVSGATLFVGDWAGTLWSVDAATGEVLSRADLGTTFASQCSPPRMGITSTPQIHNGKLYVAGGDDSFYALDAQTLEVLWRTRLGDNSEAGGYYGWCSPALAGGKILQGVSSNCDNPLIAGKLVAMDPVSGEIVAESLFETEGLVGAGVWTSPAVDVDAGKVFVVTGSADDLYDGYAFCMVRLSLETLAIEQSWRVDPGDVNDSDWGSSPTLFKNALGAPLVGAGQKDGSYYAFRRGDVSRGPIWTTLIARGGDCPQCGQGTLSTAAYDGIRLYVGGGALPGTPLSEQGGTVVALDPTTGAILWRRTLEAPVIAPVSAVRGAVFATTGNSALALDAETGETLWSFQTQAQCVGGIAIAAGRIFFGDLAGNLYAFAVQ